MQLDVISGFFGKIACTWDDLEPLLASLRKKGLYKGITVTVSYNDLAGEYYETAWQLNLLLYEGNRFIPREGRQDLQDRF